MKERSDPCPSCGAPMLRQATSCERCRWRRGDPVPPAGKPTVTPPAEGAEPDDLPSAPPPAGPARPGIRPPRRDLASRLSRRPQPQLRSPPQARSEAAPAQEETAPMPSPERRPVRTERAGGPKVPPPKPAEGPKVPPPKRAGVPRLHSHQLLPVHRPPPVRVTPLGVVVLSVVALTAAAAFVGALVRLGTTSPQDVAEVIEAKVTLGPEGGTVPFGGGRLVVPPGAVSEPVPVVVTPVPFERVRGAAPVEASVVWAFSPQDVRFAVPVEVVFPIPDRGRPAEVFVVTPQGMRRLEGVPDLEKWTVSVYTFDLAFRSPAPAPAPEPPAEEDES